jgi:hypothetical protein
MLLKRVMSQLALDLWGVIYDRVESNVLDCRAQVNVTDPVGLAIVAAIPIAVAALAASCPYSRDAFDQ